MVTTIPYFKFMDARTTVLEAYGINDVKCSILRNITDSFFADKKVRVGDLLVIRRFGSQATVHSLIKNLIKHKFIETESDLSDGRIKYLKPSLKTIKMFEKLNLRFLKTHIQ